MLFGLIVVLPDAGADAVVAAVVDWLIVAVFDVVAASVAAASVAAAAIAAGVAAVGAVFAAAVIVIT